MITICDFDTITPEIVIQNLQHATTSRDISAVSHKHHCRSIGSSKTH